MPLRPVHLVAGFTIVTVASGAEPPSGAASVSPIRQYLHESIKARLPAKPPSAPTTPETKPAEKPIVLPAFIVEESRDKQERRALAIVDGQKAMEERLSYHPLFKTDRIEILQRPIMDDFPSQSAKDRLKLNIFQLKW